MPHTYYHIHNVTHTCLIHTPHEYATYTCHIPVSHTYYHIRIITYVLSHTYYHIRIITYICLVYIPHEYTTYIQQVVFFFHFPFTISFQHVTDCSSGTNGLHPTSTRMIETYTPGITEFVVFLCCYSSLELL